ncbi:MAG: hypothetical protein J0I29_05140 [Rhizobiales bacterium]|nr:hypothetical protein [Hyphomicrobiales bacterium]
MPADAIVVVIGVVAMFGIFAVTILWASHRTSSVESAAPSAPVKRRPF